MRPRIATSSRFGGSNLCIRQAPSTQAHLPMRSAASVVTMATRRKHKDPYALALAKQIRDANLSRRKELQEQRNQALGDPVRGITTPFVKSFDDVGGSTFLMDAESLSKASSDAQVQAADDIPLNHFLKTSELQASIKLSRSLTEPIVSSERAYADPAREADDKQKHGEGHSRAITALTRIVSLANASQKDKTRANFKRCIETFGRHNTDLILKPRSMPNPSTLGDKPLPTKTPRAGPDTGSSEVQIAILTAKIRVLAGELEKPGAQNDKMNKRNLRLLVHKRQKLLKYLRAKERGGERWLHVVNTLGLTEGTWQGEISL